MPDTNEPKPHWLQVLAVGRRPSVTLLRIVVLVLVCVVVFKFVLLPIRVEGISMEPTYHNHSVNFINRLAYWRHEPQRGDIVSVRLAGESVMLLKRIIALPGETVEFRDGKTFINGRLLDEPYLKGACNWEHEAIQCGAEQFFVVGDNRTMQYDLHEKGRAERGRIIGKLLL